MTDRCHVYRGSAVEEWAIEQHNYRPEFTNDQCTMTAYMVVTEESDDTNTVPICKIHGESWLGNEPQARVTEILVATPEEVAAAIASIQGGKPT